MVEIQYDFVKCPCGEGEISEEYIEEFGIKKMVSMGILCSKCAKTHEIKDWKIIRREKPFLR